MLNFLGLLRKKTINLNFFIPSSLFLISFLLYLHNLSPSVYGGDVGDLVTASYVGGVAHAPGYPLFMILGFLFSHLPFYTPAWRLGLISVFSAAFSVVFVYFSSKLLTKDKIISILTSLIFGLCYLFWFYAEIGEVFAFHIFFISLLFYLALLFRSTRNKNFLYLLGFTFALSCTNHQTTILFLPSILLLTVPTYFKLKKNKFKTSAMVFGIFAITFCSIYSYVIIASSHNPPINWDHVHDLSSFLRLVLRRDYGTLTAGYFQKPNFIQTTIILKSYLFSVLTQLTIPVVTISILGYVVLLLRDKFLAFALLLGFIISGPFFIAYSGFPLASAFIFGVYERFFSMSALMIIFAFPFGILFLANWFGNIFKRELYTKLFVIVFFIIPLILFVDNLPKTNLSAVWIGDNLGYDILSPLPKNSVLFMGGDTALFNAWYVRYVFHLRPDVQIVNMNGLVDDTYMIGKEKIFKQTHPNVKSASDILAGTINQISRANSVFSATPIEGDSITLAWVPKGLIYELISDTSHFKANKYISQTNLLWKNLHIDYRRDSNSLGSFTISEIPKIYSSGLLNTGVYLQSKLKDSSDAYLYYKKAVAVDPQYSSAFAVLGLYQFTINDCKDSVNSLEQAISDNEFSSLTYFLLYDAYTNCEHNSDKAKEVVKRFDTIFGQDFFSVAKKSFSSGGKKS